MIGSGVKRRVGVVSDEVVAVVRATCCLLQEEPFPVSVLSPLFVGEEKD